MTNINKFAIILIMKIKEIKILIFVAIFVAFSFFAKISFASSDFAEAYVNAYNSTIVDPDDLKNYKKSSSSSDESSSSSSTSSKSASKNGEVVNNYYSLFSNFGTKTTTDNSSSTKTSNNVSSSSSTKNSQSSNLKSSEEDSVYGGAIDVTGMGLGANAQGSGNFMPDTFGEWFLVVLLILVIIILARILTKTKPKNKNPQEVKFS